MAGVYENNLQSLADIVSPVDAAVQAGIQNQNANQAAQLENQKAAAVLPYAAPTAAAEAREKEGLASLYGEQGTELGLRNQATRQTQPSAIQADIAGNKLKVSQDQVQAMSTVGQMAGQFAGVLDSVPAPARQAYVQQYLNEKNVDPQIGQMLSQVPPEQLPDVLRGISQKMIQQSAAFQTEKFKQESESGRATDVANISSEGRVQASANMANARVQAARIAQLTHMQSQTFEQASVQAERAGDHAGAERFRQAAQQIRQLGPQITASLVGQSQAPVFDQGGGGTPSAAPTNTAPTQGNPAPAPVPTAQGSYIVGDTEYMQLPDGRLIQRKVQK